MCLCSVSVALYSLFGTLYNVSGACFCLSGLCTVCWGFVQSVGSLYNLLGLPPQADPWAEPRHIGSQGQGPCQTHSTTLRLRPHQATLQMPLLPGPFARSYLTPRTNGAPLGE